jgi:ABC-2 type transport system ATP-binding protein
MLAVEVANLSYAYGERVALKKVSFAVGQRDMFGIVGPNGSGKSTLFKLLATLLDPSDGSAIICQRDIRRESHRVRAHIGVVFQTSSLDGKLTLEENLRHYGQFYGLRGARLRDRVGTVLARTGLNDRRSELVERLSGGLRRRGDVARCLLHEPDVLLLDEPTTGLDPVARREFWRYLNEIRAERDLTILVTTHLMSEADRCDQLALLHQGEIVALASPEELKREMGYDVLTIQTQQPQELASQIQEQFHLEPRVVANAIRIEVVEGHQFVARIVDAYPGLIESVNVSKPSIEDVFVLRTGATVQNS